MLHGLLRVIKIWRYYREKGLSHLMFEESFAPILPRAIQTISLKTCVRRYTVTAKNLLVCDAY